MNEWKLFGADGKEITIGDRVTDFRGEIVTIAALYPPKKASLCGHYQSKESGGTYGVMYYVSTINAKFVQGTDDKNSHGEKKE